MIGVTFRRALQGRVQLGVVSVYEGQKLPTSAYATTTQAVASPIRNALTGPSSRSINGALLGAITQLLIGNCLRYRRWPQGDYGSRSCQQSYRKCFRRNGDRNVTARRTPSVGTAVVSVIRF